MHHLPCGESFAYSHISTKFMLDIDKKQENKVFCYITKYMIYTCDNLKNQGEKAVFRLGNIRHNWNNI